LVFAPSSLILTNYYLPLSGALAVQENSVLDFGVVEKSGSFVGSVIHLPSSVLIKHSAKTAEKAISLCLRDLNDQISKLKWFYTEYSDGLIVKLSINGHFNFSCSGITVVAFEKYLESFSIQLLSLHQFSFNDKNYSGYVCNPKSHQQFIEAIINNDKFELMYC
jgi:hypothetical protein